MKILIVEDSEVMRCILTEQLGIMPGVNICGMANEPYGALSIIRENSPDMVILDIVLKDGNGFEVMRQIKDEAIPVRIMVLTNYAFPQYREKCCGMGASYFFDKSMEMDRALQTVREMAGCEQ